MPETTEQVDHRAEARKWLQRAVRSGRTAENRTADAAVAQVHASLVLAAELRVIREGLSAVVRTNEERQRLKEAAIRGVSEIGALDDPRAGDWPSIETDHAKVLVEAAFDCAAAALDTPEADRG